jgi:HEAT repeat protein
MSEHSPNPSIINHLKVLDQKRDDWRETVVEPLAQIGAPAVAGLIERLHLTVDLDVRQRAAVILGRLGSNADGAMPALIECVVDRNRDMRNESIRALKQIDPNWLTSAAALSAIPLFIEKLGRRSPNEVHNVAKLALSSIGGPAVPELIRTLSSSGDDQQQGLVAETLGRIGSDAASAVSPLNQALSSEHLHVRRLAAEALGQLGQAAEPAVTKLLQTLTDESLGVRGVAAKSLAQIESAFEVAAPAVFRLLANKFDELRNDAVEALAAMGPGTVPMIVELLEAPNIENLLQGRLEQLEQDLKNYQEWVKRRHPNKGELLTQDEFNSIKISERWLLEEISSEFDQTVRLAAIEVLAKIGPPAQEAEPTLLTLLTDERLELRAASAKALAEIRPETSAALNALMQTLLDRQESVRSAAVGALDAIEPEWRVTPMADQMMDTLIDGMKQGNSTAGAPLVRFGPVAAPKLIGLLRDESRSVRQPAVELLGQIGSDAASVMDALEAVVATDPHGLVRRAAGEALKQIRQAS